MLYLIACTQGTTESAEFAFKNSKNKSEHDSALTDSAASFSDNEDGCFDNASEESAEIHINVDDFYPRGMAINAVDGTLYVSSHGLGIIHQAKSIHQDGTDPKQPFS